MAHSADQDPVCNRILRSRLWLQAYPRMLRRYRKAQAEAPGPGSIGQAIEKLRDDLFLLTALRTIAKAGLAEAKRPAGQRDAAPFVATTLAALSWPRHCFPSASRSRSACMPRPENIRFNRRFSSSGTVRGSFELVAFTVHSGSERRLPAIFKSLHCRSRVHDTITARQPCLRLDAAPPRSAAPPHSNLLKLALRASSTTPSP